MAAIIEKKESMDSIELKKQTIKLYKMHANGLQLIMNGIKLDLEQLIGCPNCQCEPYFLFYSEMREA